MKLDLHTHTNCSDGTDDWKTLLEKAEQTGLQYLSITDHNNCDVYFQMKNPEKYFSGKIITGIEPECIYKGLLIELLGYNIDVIKTQELLKGLYPPKQEVLQKEYERLYDKCVKSGVQFTTDIFQKWNKKKHYYGG